MDKIFIERNLSRALLAEKLNAKLEAQMNGLTEQGRKMELRAIKAEARIEAVKDHLFLTIWIHGSVDDHATPCGEVDINNIGGKDITVDLLDLLINSDNIERMEWFKGLPTERWLMVEIKSKYDSGDYKNCPIAECWYPEIIEYKALEAGDE